MPGAVKMLFLQPFVPYQNSFIQNFGNDFHYAGKTAISTARITFNSGYLKRPDYIFCNSDN